MLEDIYDYDQDYYTSSSLSTLKISEKPPSQTSTMAVHHIHVRNMSNHPQRFLVHGWNNEKDIVVKPHSTAKIAAADGSSGAIIAIHEGQEGEQAEITKAGFEGNDFIDLSNIVGAGGNLIVQQVGAPGTRKGDPLFMQHLNKAWDKASNETKKKLEKSVTVRRGKMIRIGPIKDNPDLEDFVRTFADGKTYIGVGSWGGSPGNDNDNKQSSAAHGSKDILICYNDGDARPHKRKKGDGKDKGGDGKNKKPKKNQKTADQRLVDQVDSDDQSENESAAEDDSVKMKDVVLNRKSAAGPNVDKPQKPKAKETENKENEDEMEEDDEGKDDKEDGQEENNDDSKKPAPGQPPSEDEKQTAKKHQGGPPTKDDTEVDKEDEEADKKRQKDSETEKEKDAEPNYDHPLFKGLCSNTSRKQPENGDEKKEGEDAKADQNRKNNDKKEKDGKDGKDKKNKGPGIELVNKSNRPEEYFFYNNFWNGNGTAGANFDHPMKSVHLKPDDKKFVKLPASFKGRLQRGKELPSTWVEFQLEASDDHAAHGDISLEQGCDGAAKIASTDGSNVHNGFDYDVIAKAPAAAIRRKPNGEKAIDTTMGNWMTGPNHAAIYYLNKVVGQKKAYIVGGTGTPDVASKNRRLLVEMY